MARTVRRPVAATKDSTTTTTKTATKAVAPSADGMAEIPDKSFADSYINRMIGAHKDFDILQFALDNKHNVLIEGDTGTGKTSLAMAFAASKGIPFYSVSSSRGVDPTQLFGKHIPGNDVPFVWQDGAVTHMVRMTGPRVLLINEINFLPEGIASVLFGLLDKRRKIELVDHKSEVIHAPDGLLIIADYNDGYRGTRPLNEALRNRFAIKLTFDYDKKIETKLVKSESLRSVAAKLRDSIAAGEYETPVSTNMLVEFEQMVGDLGLPFAISNFINAFPVDDRPSVKGVFDLWEGNLQTDYATTTAVTTEDWSAEDVDWEYSEDDFFKMEEIAGLTVDELREAAYQTDCPKRRINAMQEDELRLFLTGDHPYWKE